MNGPLPLWPEEAGEFPSNDEPLLTLTLTLPKQAPLG